MDKEAREEEDQGPETPPVDGPGQGNEGPGESDTDLGDSSQDAPGGE